MPAPQDMTADQLAAALARQQKINRCLMDRIESKGNGGSPGGNRSRHQRG